MGRPHIPLIERYERAIRRDPGGCWVWTKHVASAGYPQLRVGRTGNGPIWLVHRWAYTHFVGPIPPGMLVLHHCDNKRCSNPAHLYCGTQADNVADMIRRGRQGPRSPGRPRTISAEIAAKIAVDTRANHVVAAQYGVSESTVCRFKRRHSPVHT